MGKEEENTSTSLPIIFYNKRKVIYMSETITVTGKAKLSMPPDTICVNLLMETIRDTYEETMEASTKSLNMLREVLKSEGFEKKDIITKKFVVDLEYDTYKDHDFVKKKIVGFKCCHFMKIEFPIDGKRLSRIVSLFTICPVCLDFSIHYMIGDMEQAKNNLLEKAVMDSRNKAQLIARASGVEIGKVQSINYSWEENKVFYEPVKYSRETICEQAICYTEDNLDIEPDVFELTDVVTITYNILS